MLPHVFTHWCRSDLAAKLSGTLFDLIMKRDEEREKCNMVLLLLMASVEFDLPAQLLLDTLETTKLTNIGKLLNSDLFLLNTKQKVEVVSLLVSAAKLDRDNKQDGSLYDKLFLALHILLTELILKGFSGQRPPELLVKKCRNPSCRQFWSLLASEVALLFVIVPSFYSYLGKDSEVGRVLRQATGDARIVKKATHLLQLRGGSEGTLRPTSEYLTERVQEFHFHQRSLMADPSLSEQASFILTASEALPCRPVPAVLLSSETLHLGSLSVVERLPMEKDALMNAIAMWILGNWSGIRIWDVGNLRELLGTGSELNCGLKVQKSANLRTRPSAATPTQSSVLDQPHTLDKTESPEDKPSLDDFSKDGEMRTVGGTECYRLRELMAVGQVEEGNCEASSSGPE
nr:PREDICTED: uncharacterized protein LOC106704219 [Latimeria chalumnae]|eukprot:XP_014346199.1 PREDICTED: uncharacterized protein LOC106704219 [Latimeria chalumnae]